MRPAIEPVLNAMVAQIDASLTVIPPGPERMRLHSLRSLFNVILREMDNAAAMRLDEIKELRGLLRNAAPICPPELGARLGRAADEARDAEQDIRLSALERTLDALRTALIELHTWLETSTHSGAPALLAQCWSFLARANAKRAFSVKPW